MVWSDGPKEHRHTHSFTPFFSPFFFADPAIRVRSGNVDITLPKGQAFSVKCPSGSEVPCDGSDVHLVGGSCVPKAKRYTQKQAQELVAMALQAQLEGITVQFAKFEKKIAANQQELVKSSTTAAEAHIQGVAGVIKAQKDKLGKLDAAVRLF